MVQASAKSLVAIDDDIQDAILDGKAAGLTLTEWRTFRQLWHMDGGWSGSGTATGKMRWHVYALRRKLGYDVILSRRGFGYMLARDCSDRNGE